jgi:hypothetical protein
VQSYMNRQLVTKGCQLMHYNVLIDNHNNLVYDFVWLCPDDAVKEEPRSHSRMSRKQPAGVHGRIGGGVVAELQYSDIVVPWRANYAERRDKVNEHMAAWGAGWVGNDSIQG